MANQSSLSDILQAIGYSELIEDFEILQVGQPKDLFDLLTDNTSIINVVPRESLDDFKKKIEHFYADKLSAESDESSSEASGDEEVNGKNREREHLENNNPNKTLKLKKVLDNVYPIENVDIEAILNSTFEGRQILAWHNAKSFLTTGKRKRLVHFVIAGVLNECGRNLQGHDFHVLSQKIVKLFPKECEIVYYEPGVSSKKSETGKRKKTKGKLFNKYNNLKKIKLNFDEQSKSSNQETIESEILPSEEIKESIEWLETYEEPWENTQKHWQITSDFRYSQIKEELKNKISSIYERWPILKCPKGYSLIVQDFAAYKLTKNCDAVKSFKDFFVKALEVRPLPKDEVCDVLKGMLNVENLKEDNEILVQLMLLCIILPSTARIAIGKRKRWKPSAVESLEGIVTRIKIHGDIDEVKTQRHQNARMKNITVQPYIIVVEESDYAVDSVYVCIDDILYLIPSLVEALDVCFKAFHVFQALYTAQSEHIWLLLQLGLYKFRSKWDKSIPTVNELLNDMGCLATLPNI